MDKDITQKKVWSTMQVISIISFFVVMTFYATVIYLQIQSIEERLDKKIKIINQNSDDINELQIQCKENI